MRETPRRFALFTGAVLFGLISSLRAATDTSDAPIRGVRGEPTARAVVQWSEMVRADAAPPPKRPAKESEGPRRIPRDMPMPKGALVRMEAGVEAVAIAKASLPPSPAPAASFEALPDDFTTQPPDTHGAVGPNHLMVTLNSQVRVQDRSGRPLSTVALFAFWAGISGGDPFDPRILYDPYADRWITTAVGNFFRSLLVGVSRSGDPTGSWNLYRIDPDPADRVDFPVVGFNKNWIVVMSSWLTVDQGWRGAQYRVFEKADLYAGGRGSYTLIPAVGGGPEPAVTLDPEVAALYLLQVWNGNADGNGVLRLATITGAIGAEVLTPVTFIATPNPWSSLPPDGDLSFCPQMGDPRKLPCFGGFQPVFRNGTIWGAHIVYLPAGAPTRSAIQWWQIAPDGGVVQRGLLDDPLAILYYGFPSLAVNRSGDMLLGFSSFSAQQFASGSFAYRAAGDPPGTLRAERVLKAGEDSYYRDPEGHGTRWGDYSATSVDPVNDTDLWTIQEYAAARDPVSSVYRWGTWWGPRGPGGRTRGTYTASASRAPPNPPCVAAARAMKP